jgi:hypothetical protein
MDDTTAPVHRDSPAWLFFVRIAFVVALAGNALGIVFLQVDPWRRAFLGMGTLFLVTSTITMSKTLRDDFEARRLLNRITEARTTKLLREFEET